MSVKPRRLVGFAVLIGAISVTAIAQTAIKKGPPPSTSASSGEEMYKAYCAACHGIDGKGDGPAAASLKAPPTDLTQITAKNNGKFPTAEVYSAIKGDPEKPTPAHGSMSMPVWGTIFRSMNQHSESIVHLRITNLVKYIETIQAK